MSTLKAAASSVQIPAGPDMAIGGGIMPGYSAEQEGELRASALILEADTRVCIVSCDVLCLTRDICDRAAKSIEEHCGVAFDNVMITATHTHHAPTTFTVHGYSRDEKFAADVEASIVQAARQAAEYLDSASAPNEVEAEFLFARGWEATVGRNSRFLLKDGTIAWGGHSEEEIVRPTGPYDPEMPVIAFRRPTGQLAAGIFVHADHNIGVRKHGRSPGFYGLAAQEAEQRHGAPFLFLPGAFGSTHPADLSVDEKIHRVGAAIDDAMNRLRTGLRGPVKCVKVPFKFRVRRFDEGREDAAVSYWCNRWFDSAQASQCIEVFRNMRRELASRQGEEQETWLQVIRLGDIAVVGVPGEMFGSLGMAIRNLSPFRHTIVVGLANDEIGYIADSEAMDLGGYQVWTGFHSILEKGAGEAMVDACVDLLNRAAEEASTEGARIREIAEGDALRLQTFYNTLDSPAKTLFHPIGWNASLSDCENIVRQALAGKRHDLVIDCLGKILGWAFASGLDSDHPTLGIGTSEELRGQGFGARLTERVVEFVRRRGNKGIDLTVVRTNDRARLLYERFGFKITGTRTGADGLAYYEMRLEF